MLLLGLDTATLTLSVALVERGPDGDRLVERVTEPPPKPHSSLLPGVVEQMLARAGAAPRDLKGIVVGLGPGSFTGLRIGLATAKGISYAAGIPLAGDSSLAAMALAAAPDVAEGTLLVPCLDARKGEVYAGFFRKEGTGLRALEGEAALAPERLIEKLGGETKAPCVFGIGREAYPALAALPAPATRVNTPDAYALVQLVRELPAFDPQKTFGLEPHYVRPSDHEWKLKTKQPRQ